MKEVIAVLGIIFLAIWLLTGCITTQASLDPNYVAYLEAKKIQPKIIEIVAKPGEMIQMSGIERFTVFSPENLNVTQHP